MFYTESYFPNHAPTRQIEPVQLFLRFLSTRVISKRDATETLASASVYFSCDFDSLNHAKRLENLFQHIFFYIRVQIVDVEFRLAYGGDSRPTVARCLFIFFCLARVDLDWCTD